MRQRIRSHITYANVVATLALFLVLGGMSYAATGGNFILGKSNSASTATQLSSGAGNALKVSNANGGTGVYASGGNRAKSTAAIHGQSGAGNGLEGYSTANPASGVFGQDNNAASYGVAGHSDNGIAVVGDSSNGWAMQALGNTTQTRNANGFVKAMALVDAASHPSDPIQQCFNSQLPPTQATSGNCGITIPTSCSGGTCILDFGFRVDDRFISVTAHANRAIATAGPGAPSPTSTVLVSTFWQLTNSYSDVPFYVFVY